MINLVFVKKCCKDYTKIENYEEAANDTTQTWICHHILGEILSREQLLDHDFYYDVPPCMLKFVTRAEHNRMHIKGRTVTDETRRKMSEANKGHVPWNKGKIFGPLTEEHRRKISEANSGENNSMYGKTHSEESRRKMSEARKGRPSPRKGVTLSEETRKKISKNGKGKHYGWCPSVEWREKAKDRVHKKSAFYQKFGMTVDDYKIHNKLTCSCSTIRRMFKNGDI